MINMKKVLVMMNLLINFQMMKMCLIMRMVFHPKIKLIGMENIGYVGYI